MSQVENMAVYGAENSGKREFETKRGVSQSILIRINYYYRKPNSCHVICPDLML
jgi:hypothetical protein